MNAVRNILKIFLFLFLMSRPLYAQGQQIEIVFDASRSMNELVPGSQNSRLDEAKKALQTVAEQIAPGSHVGLRIFGKMPVQGNVRDSCFDSKLSIPIQPYQKQAMLDEVVGLAANGQTPLGYSLELAGQDFAPDAAKKTVILISDGEESCGKDPVNVIGALKARGISFVVHAIGFAVDPKTKAQLQQITNMTGGTYQDAKSGVQLQESLQKVAAQEKILDPAVPVPAGKLSEAKAEEEAQKELLLRAQRGKGENLIAAAGGAKIVSATNEDAAYAIDGSDETYAALDPGDQTVISFKDNQPILLEGFAIPITEQNDSNPKEIQLSGSLEDPHTGFFAIANATFTNKVDFKNVDQEFKIDPPAALRYLKVTASTGFEATYANHREWKVFGKVLTEEEFKTKSGAQAGKERNLIAKDAGGQIIASSQEGFEVLIDGAATADADSVSLDSGNEVIFGFQNGQSAYLTKFAVPVFGASQTNCKTFELSVSQSAPDSGYAVAGTFQTTNLLMGGKPFQEYQFSKPVQAKYVKVKSLEDHGGNDYCELTELQIVGTFSAPANFDAAAQAALPPSAPVEEPAAPEKAEEPAAVEKEEEPSEVSEELIKGGEDYYNDFETEDPAPSEEEPAASDEA